MLNENLKTKICYNLTFFWNFSLWGFFWGGGAFSTIFTVFD